MAVNDIIKTAAQKRGVSVNEIRKGMQAAINEAWQSCPDNGMTRARLNRIPCKGERPTPEEFMEYMANQLY